MGAPVDFEDAVHRFSTFEESPGAPELERGSVNLGVEDDDDRLERA